MELVTPRLYGHMGNQMFQIAAAIGYAVQHNVSYGIPQQCVGASFTHHPFAKVKYILPWADVGKIKFRWSEEKFSYVPIPAPALVQGDWLEIDGYFQTEKYFAHARKQILDAFDFPCEPLTDTVGVHWRMGDYRQHPTKHPIVGVEYIASAIEFMMGKSYRHFLFFSDEPDEVEKIIKSGKLPGGNCYTVSRDRTARMDMHLMSCCKDQIISNSTFGWWAAWLNQSPGKMCVAPAQWFGPDYADLDTSDIYPANTVIL